MAQAAAVVINDGQATPVATTFNPAEVTPANSIFEDRSAGMSLGFRTMRVTYSRPTNTRPTTRASLEVVTPVTQLVGGVTSVAFTGRAKLEFILPNGMTDAQRKDLYAFVVNALSNTLVRGALRDLDPLY